MLHYIRVYEPSSCFAVVMVPFLLLWLLHRSTMYLKKMKLLEVDSIEGFKPEQFIPKKLIVRFLLLFVLFVKKSRPCSSDL